MTSTRKIATCLIVIMALVLAEGGFLLAAGVGSDALVEQLRSDIDLLLGVSGAIITVLVTTVGILWQSFRANQREFIETLKSIQKD